MTVAELIELLEGMDPDAKVHIMTQQAWPFECELRGVVARSDFDDPDDERDGTLVQDLSPDDVFLVEGAQIRYGSKAAWEAT